MNKFNGPIFIVGMPRSGTKLLRYLLNNHSNLAFPSSETQILPYWVAHWKEYGNLMDFTQFQKFYNEAKKHSFFSYMQKRHSKCISATEWHRACSGGGVAEVFEALVKLDSNWSQEMIWGDKSPYYIKHITLLKQIYPNAKIIHIVRDVRDYCLSINHAWGKNMIRAAQRWQDDTSVASLEIKTLGTSGFEVRFEDLLSNPQRTLSKICNFLGIDFETSMLELNKPTENIGGAKGEKKIVTKNKEKWLMKMDSSLVEKIESICITQLHYYKYQTKYKGRQKRISKFKANYYRLLDSWNLIITDSDNRGIFKNLIFCLRNNKMKILPESLNNSHKTHG